MYDHTKQYRCTIIRGKSQKEMDDLLPAYAKVIDEICPCRHEEFEQLFNNAFQRFLPESERVKKTLDNHRTEISGKLFGMYFFSEDGVVYESERTQKYLNDNDQPAFFKDICYKMQFPNGMQKTSTTVAQRVEDGINIRPNAFIIKLLQIAETARVKITKRELGYYVLNSLDVLQGNASPYEVLEVISQDQYNGIERDITVPGKALSYTHQHINEQINYLELANLIRVTEDKRVLLNPNEKAAIEKFTIAYDLQPEFNVYAYELRDSDTRKKFQFDWDAYYGRLSPCADYFATSPEALIYTDVKKAQDSTGNPDKADKMNRAEFVKYIEVKSTKRLTCPDIDDPLWIDTLNLTRNEWIAAKQHKGYYAIYRVFFTRDGVTIFVIRNVAEKIDDGRIQATPMTYRVDFSNSSVDKKITLGNEVK